MALVILGAICLLHPQLFGNGKSIAPYAFLGRAGLPLLLDLLLHNLLAQYCAWAAGPSAVSARPP